NGETVWTLRRDWREVVAQRAACWSEQEEYTLDRVNLARPESVRLVWRGGKGPYAVEIGGQCLEVMQNKCSVFNLETDREYDWRVTDSNGETVVGRLKTAYSPRLIGFPDPDNGPANFRDWGGWKTVDGRRLKQGRVYRGAAPELFVPSTEKNLQFLKDVLKIRTDLDLRYETQVVGRTRSDLGEGVRWIHKPVNAYSSFTEEQNRLFAETIRLFADPELYPVFVHCAGGCDRTGEIVFLVQAVCGLSDEDLFTEYELTSLWAPRPRTIPYLVDWLEKIAAFSDGEQDLRRQVAIYLEAIGVTAAEQEQIRQNLQA
ncbi:MAG: tyrosine-protein phosphatase, partial [Lentisphaeria bacterium]|nr:tyrosine-protein phosphatase [Lentisphaeria bacterium]